MAMVRKISSVKVTLCSTAIFSIILTLGFVFAISDSIPVTAHGAWQEIVVDSVNVEAQGPNVTVLSLTAEAPVPHVERIILGGFGWMYVGGDHALVVVSHYGVRDSVQNPDHWHVHNMFFDSVQSASFSHCIREGGLSFDDTAGAPINEDDIRVIIQNSKLEGTLVDPPIAISFDIMPDPLKMTCVSGFGIGIHTTEPAPEVFVEEEKKGGGGNPNK